MALDIAKRRLLEITRWHYPADSVVQVISVVEPPFFPTTYPLGGVDMDVYDQLEKAAREAAEKAATKLRAGDESSKLSVTTKVLSGSPKLVILEEAEAFGADLIVVGSHGHEAVERFLLGSVSQAVALHAVCSVRIVRSPKTRRSESTRGAAAVRPVTANQDATSLVRQVL